MTKDNEKKKDNSKYIMWAIVLAFVSALFLDILAKLIVIVFNLAVQYWYVAIIIIFVLIILKKIGRRKKKK